LIAGTTPERNYMNNKYNQMRFYTLILVFLLLNTLTSCSQNNKGVPKEFRNYITQSKTPIEYKDIIPFYGEKKDPAPAFITKKEALEDIEMFEYLFKTSYSGFEYWENQGVDFNGYFSGLKSFVNQKDTVSTEQFEDECAKILTLIHDGHISLIGKNRHDAYEHKSVYYCDIIVEETNDGEFMVIHSQFDLVKKGDLFTQKDHEKYLFKTLSPTGKKHYLIGLLSYHPITSEELSFNDKSISVPFDKSRLTFAKYNDSTPFHIERINNIPVVRVMSFANEIFPAMKEFMESGNQLKKENQIIVNIMNNGGGASLFPQTFIQNLNGTALWESYWATLKSPSIFEYFADYDLNSITAASPNFRDLILSSKKELAEYQDSPSKTWEFSSISDEKLLGTYKGRMIVLVNRSVLSAGESFVGASQSIRNRIVVGENTGGCGMFSSACGYYLPNSKLIVNLPRHFILIPGFEECVGFFPDYWLNTSDPLKEIMNWLKDPDNYRFTYSSSFDQEEKTNASSLVLPDDLELVAPGADIPANTARFLGKWFGVSDGVLDHLLIVEKIHSNDDIDAIYAWGTAPQWNIHKPGYRRFRGKIENQKLILTDGTVTITYTFISEKELHSTYERPGVFSITELTKIE
jgi:hypothetical protein